MFVIICLFVLGYEKLVRFESEDQTVVYEAQMLKVSFITIQ